MRNRLVFALIAVLVAAFVSDRSSAQGVLPTQTLNLYVDPPVDIANVEVQSLDGAVFRPKYETWSLKDVTGKGITFKVKLPTEMPFVWNMNVAAATVEGKPDCAFSITVNGKVYVESYADTNDHFHPVQFEIDPSVLKKENTITVALNDFATTQLFINAVTVSSFAQPQNLVSANGKLDVPLYAQFGIATITGAQTSEGKPAEYDEIWSRAYGINRPEDDPRNEGQWMPSLELIPGPSFVYKPNDLFQVRLENQLNKTKNKWLDEFENSISPSNPDDIPEHVTHEINIPHDGDNTNLHVHGLHVDPRRDNVLLLLIPEDDDPAEYSESLRKDIPNLKPNPGANGKYWTWKYSYKIPADHLPGTHWYHSHKHGSTSTQVENGMAGAMVIRPKDDANTFAPGLWNDDPYKTHDRVMVLQEIANYGVQQGKGTSADVKSRNKKVKDVPPGAPDITVNGLHQPTLQVIPGQIERWRFVNAGANHRTSSYLWLGKDTGKKDANGVAIYENAVPENDGAGTPQMYLVAVDGITLSSPVKVTASSPAVVAAGNRSDFMIRIPDQGEYAIFKNYPQPGSESGGVTNEQPPSKILVDPFDLGVDYLGFKKTWPSQVNQSGMLTADSELQATPIVPLLSAQANGNLVQVRFTPDTTKFEGVGWQPVKHKGGGAVDNQLLAFVNTRNVSGPSSNGPIPADLRSVNLSPYSPTGSAERLTYIDENGKSKLGKPPGYAAPIADKDISIAPVSMVFDLAGAAFLYKDQFNMQQFSLNGRQFNLNDFVGNPAAEQLIQYPIPRNAYATEDDDKPLGKYNYAAIQLWTNEIAALDSKAYWTNPGYYVPLIQKETKGQPYYTYDYSNNDLRRPTYRQVTGLDRSGQPTAQSAQEWILINNSSIFHPFHIHISPFFVTEVGQLNYDAADGWTTRYIYGDRNGAPPERQSYERRVTDSKFQYVVGNWWDVLMIPPHGYVKFRTWINVPKQTPPPEEADATDFTVKENTNSVASWVFHCHILRHEDRGMMMIVKTKKK